MRVAHPELSFRHEVIDDLILEELRTYTNSHSRFTLWKQMAPVTMA